MPIIDARANRPLSPHLSIYHFYLTRWMSVLHRATGMALYAGTLLVAWWLIAVASGPGAFATVSAVMGSWFGQLVLFGYTWAMFHHMLGGIRHFVWDTGAGMEKHDASKLGWATLVGSVLLTAAVWAVYLAIL